MTDTHTNMPTYTVYTYARTATYRHTTASTDFRDAHTRVYLVGGGAGRSERVGTGKHTQRHAQTYPAFEQAQTHPLHGYTGIN